ncbi:hypothetical protein [Phytobacter sp. RSE-02]|uniref:hypothetical protein n=1 Tax=Phytobacter sp. RSE-02 TaxID=3229229 RepID=UPI00339D68A5
MNIQRFIKHINLESISPKCFFFALGTLFWMFIDVYITKGIDSSFISAIADTVLALLAVLAIIKAKEFWKEKSKQDGYHIATRLLNDHYIKSVVSNGLSECLNPLQKRLNHLAFFYSKLENGKVDRVAEVELISKLVDIYRELSDVFYEKIFPHNQEVQFDIFRMRATDINFSSNEFGSLLSDHFNLYRRITIALESVVVDVGLYLDAFYEGGFNKKSTKNDISPPGYKRDLERRLSGIYQLVTHLIEQDQQMRTSLNIGVGRGITIAKCFTF